MMEKTIEDMTMNNNMIADEWKLILAKAKEVWSQLTDEDIQKAEAGLDFLVWVIKERYGKTREAAQNEVQIFWDKYRPDKKL